MVEFMFRIIDAVKSEGKNAACLFLSYGNSHIPFFFPSNFIDTNFRPRSWSAISKTTPTSINAPKPRPQQSQNPSRKHNPHRRLRRRKPRSLPPIPHLSSPPLNHRPHPFRTPFLAPSRRSSNLALDLFRSQH